MAKAKTTKATKGDSQGKPIITPDDRSSERKTKLEQHMSVKLPKLEAEVAEAVCAEVLRGLYVQHLNFFVKNKDVSRADKLLSKEEVEQHERVLQNLEGTICYMDQTDQWLKDLHGGKFNEQAE